MSDKIDLRISGSSTMPGGEYGQVRISGAGKVQGSLRCDSLGCSGSARVQGDVDCAAEVRSSGAVKVEGALCCGSFHGSGSTHCLRLDCRDQCHSSGSLVVEGQLEAGELQTSGALRAGDIRCGQLLTSGALEVGGGVEAESARISGGAQIPGLLNAETVEIDASHAVRIGSIGGSSIRVLPTERHGLGLLHRRDRSRAHIDTIEGDDIHLGNVEARVVRGRRVGLDADCHIGRVEYSESLTADANAVVDQQVQVD